MVGGAELFPRVVCGVDGSAAGEEAAKQAVRLADPWGEVVLVAVAMVAAGAHPESVPALRGRAAAVLEAAGRVAGERAVRRVVEAEPVAGLLAAVEHHRATLLAVGSHGTGRVAGIVTGSVATAVVHRAPCSVLVARSAGSAGPFPSRIVVGVDGSAPSLQAAGVARRLAERLGAQLELVAAAGAAELLTDEVGELRRDGRDPVAALVAACDDATLVVVGSRGLGGVRASGSVSERVAHHAPASVLVVRSG